MNRLAAAALLFLIAAPALLVARDRDRDWDRRNFNFAPPPQIATNPQADRNRSEADQAYQRGDYRRVIELANVLLTSFPADNPHVAYHLRASAQIELGRQARSAKQIREGISDARQGLSQQGQKHAWLYIPYLYGLTSLSEVERRPEHAEMAIKVAEPLVRRPVGTDFSAEEKANILYQKALAQATKGDLGAATNDYAEAIRVSPTHLGAHVNRAALLTRQDRLREAEGAYDEAVRAFPESVLVHNERGFFRRTRGQLDEAIADFTRCLQLDPKFVTGLINRGMCLTDQNNPQAAEADFAEVLKLKADPPMQAMAYRLRGAARVAQGNADAGIADISAALQNSPQEAGLVEERGYARFFKQDFAGAAADLARALQLNPAASRIVPWHALALARAEKSAESRAALSAAADVKPPLNAWLVKIVGFLADNVTEEDLLTAAAELEPQSGKDLRLCEARFFIGQKRRLAGDAEGAAAQFREALSAAPNAFPLTTYRGARYELGDFGGL